MAVDTVDPAAGAPAANRRSDLDGGPLVVAGELGVSVAPLLGEGIAVLDRGPGLLVIDLGRRLVIAITPVGRDETLLVVDGELDVATAPILEGALASSLRTRPASLVLDLRDLTFIDGRSAALLASATRRMAAWGGVVEFPAAPPAARRVFALCGFHELMRGSGPACDHARGGP